MEGETKTIQNFTLFLAWIFYHYGILEFNEYNYFMF